MSRETRTRCAGLDIGKQLGIVTRLPHRCPFDKKRKRVHRKNRMRKWPSQRKKKQRSLDQNCGGFSHAPRSTNTSLQARRLQACIVDTSNLKQNLALVDFSSVRQELAHSNTQPSWNSLHTSAAPDKNLPILTHKPSWNSLRNSCNHIASRIGCFRRALT